MMNKTMNTGNRFLDVFKRILVKFRDAGFGVKLIKNLPKLADYFNDRNVSLLGKGKVFFSFVATLILLAQQLGLSQYLPGNIMEIVNTVLLLLTMMGVLVDPTTDGIADGEDK